VIVSATASAASSSAQLAGSGLADNPALHAAIVVPLVLIGLAVYFVRRRRPANRTKRDEGGEP
jgi:hypothetical protein